MVSEKMVAWGSQGCVIRDLAAYGEQRAAVVGAENVFNFTIGNPSVPAPSCVRQTIEHLLQTCLLYTSPRPRAGGDRAVIGYNKRTRPRV